MHFSDWREGIHNVINVLETIGIADVVDIAILSLIVYYLIKLIKETRAGQIVKGVALYVFAYLFAETLGLQTLTYIIRSTLNVALIAVIILFQPEIRRALEKFGHAKITSLIPAVSFSEKEYVKIWSDAIDAICDAVGELSSTRTGALIVIEQKTKLGEQIDNGTILNAKPSKELFGNIFYPKTPLHDGAAIIRDGIIVAAACFLPKPAQEETINKKLGSRHRAAIGMSENSDAIVIVVSEETGQISVAVNGALVRDYTPETLEVYLRRKLIIEPAREKRFEKKNSKKGKGFWKIGGKKFTHVLAENPESNPDDESRRN